jgi:hypothetical protein
MQTAAFATNCIYYSNLNILMIRFLGLIAKKDEKNY